MHAFAAEIEKDFCTCTTISYRLRRLRSGLTASEILSVPESRISETPSLMCLCYNELFADTAPCCVRRFDQIIGRAVSTSLFEDWTRNVFRGVLRQSAYPSAGSGRRRQVKESQNVAGSKTGSPSTYPGTWKAVEVWLMADGATVRVPDPTANWATCTSGHDIYQNGRISGRS